MYCKLFASLYQGTLRGKPHEILVFTNLIAHCDRHGCVDKHWRAIAEETGLSIEEVKVAIEILEGPDPESRSPLEGGARIKRLDEHRAWGWQVVNYLKYREIRNADDRKEANRLAQERFRNSKKMGVEPPEGQVIEVSKDKPDEQKNNVNNPMHKHKHTTNPKKPRMIRIEGWFHRKKETEWEEDEIKAYEKSDIDNIPEDEIAIVEILYTTSLHPEKEKAFTKKTAIVRLLRHWKSEVDKAKLFQRHRQDLLPFMSAADRPPPSVEIITTEERRARMAQQS